jgi:hypothetical protein
MVNKQSTEYGLNPSHCSGVSEAHIHPAIHSHSIHTYTHAYHINMHKYDATEIIFSNLEVVGRGVPVKTFRSVKIT